MEDYTIVTRFILITLFSILLTADLMSQDITKHRWQNRLILVISKDYDNEKLIGQLAELNTCSDGLKERRLLIYQILPNQYKLSANYGNEIPWRPGSSLYDQFGSSESTFEIILVGLDGGVKLRKTDPQSCEALWAVIDRMPMRQAEIRNQD